MRESSKRGAADVRPRLHSLSDARKHSRDRPHAACNRHGHDACRRHSRSLVLTEETDMILLITESGMSSMIGGIEGEPSLRDLYALIMTDMIEVPGSGFTVNGEEIQFIVDEEGKIK